MSEHESERDEQRARDVERDSAEARLELSKIELIRAETEKLHAEASLIETKLAFAKIRDALIVVIVALTAGLLLLFCR